MKQGLIYLSFFLGIICSCEESRDNTLEEQPDPFVVIGDLDADINSSDTLIYSLEKGDSILYQIDLDSDGSVDFELCIYYDYSSCLFFSDFRFSCLNDLAKICTNDTILSPDILSLGDTLSFNRRWISDKFDIIESSGICESGGGDGNNYKYGNWVNISNKYIGLMVENNENPVYGWIKLSIPDDELICSLTIHEIGRKKPAYRN
jgi:hypothetical protein